MKLKYFMAITAIAIYSLHMHAQDDAMMVDNQELENDIIEESQDRDALIADLEVLAPDLVDEVFYDEQDLKETLSSIHSMVAQKNQRIQQLAKEKQVQQTEIAKLTIELQDAKIKLEKLVAKKKSQGKYTQHFRKATQDLLKRINSAAGILQIIFNKQLAQKTKKFGERMYNSVVGQ